MATHDPALPEALPHRTITLNKGHLVLDTDPVPLVDGSPEDAPAAAGGVP